MLSPAELKARIATTDASRATVTGARESLRRILTGEEHRLVVVVGPCSIHDPRAAIEYGRRLRDLAPMVGETLLLIMRTYFEKPRTALGWRGMLSDPDLDGSYDVVKGLEVARALLHDLNSMGVPCGTESLDPSLPGYTDDLVTWTAIGARTVESQIHRAMSSGLPMPVGLKNGTDGNVQSAVDAQLTARAAQGYLGLDQHGRVAEQRSSGNPFAHVVLRGGSAGPNYAAADVAACEAALRGAGLPARIMIDCSHANSGKQPERQPEVLEDVAQQIVAGNRAICGVMLESHLQSGNQPPGGALRYGVSITDGCLGWERTASALIGLHERLGPALRERRAEAAAMTRKVA